MTNWEDRYLAGDMPWEKGKAAPPLVELMAKVEAAKWGAGPVLVPGCGLGHDVRMLAASGFPVLGVDLSSTAMSLAKNFSKVGAESYEVGNFFDPDWRNGRKFSALWEHTCFCAINPEDRPRYAAAAAECLEEGGLLAGVFFLTPNDPGEEDVGPPFGTSIEELENHFAPWFDKVDGWVPAATYPGREGREWIGLFTRRRNA